MPNTKKLLHIVGDSKYGGGAIIILRLAEMAKAAGWQVDVLTTDPAFHKVLKKSGIGVVDIDVIWREIRPFKDLKGLFKLYLFLRSQKYQIIHTHTSKAGLIGRLAAWLAGCKAIVHTVHGFAFHEESTKLSVFLYSTLEKLAAFWCDKIVTVSHFHKDWAIKLGIAGDSKIIAIPNGIDDERICANQGDYELKSSLSDNGNSVVIMTIGRLAQQKGLEYLIDAAPDLSTVLQNPFKIVLVGTGPLENSLKERVSSLGVEDSVIFLGFREDIGSLLSACDIVVLPSLREGLSISLLEAMASEKPIITTTIGSNKEVVRNGEGAILIPPKDAAAIVDSICYLINNKSIADDFAKRGREIYLHDYTEHKMLQAYHKLYDEMLHSRRMAC